MCAHVINCSGRSLRPPTRIHTLRMHNHPRIPSPYPEYFRGTAEALAWYVYKMGYATPKVACATRNVALYNTLDIPRIPSRYCRRYFVVQRCCPSSQHPCPEKAKPLHHLTIHRSTRAVLHVLSGLLRDGLLVRAKRSITSRLHTACLCVGICCAYPHGCCYVSALNTFLFLALLPLSERARKRKAGCRYIYSIGGVCMMSPGELISWLRERKFKRESLQSKLRAYGMKSHERYKFKWDSWCRVWRGRYYDAKQRRWI